ITPNGFDKVISKVDFPSERSPKHPKTSRKATHSEYLTFSAWCFSLVNSITWLVALSLPCQNKQGFAWAWNRRRNRFSFEVDSMAGKKGRSGPPGNLNNVQHPWRSYETARSSSGVSSPNLQPLTLSRGLKRATRLRRGSLTVTMGGLGFQKVGYGLHNDS